MIASRWISHIRSMSQVDLEHIAPSVVGRVGAATDNPVATASLGHPTCLCWLGFPTPDAGYFIMAQARAMTKALTATQETTHYTSNNTKIKWMALRDLTSLMVAFEFNFMVSQTILWSVEIVCPPVISYVE